ncbi:MAG TPA: VOC family protein [Stellaceae bacterium]|jgi:catechol 2,3-dioxygenase-like lactoylglutathione lyase family enzyme|nr:VOC family protein [Stellaceae bacterium]
MLPSPGFHHIHLRSIDPDAAIGFYTRQFPSTRKARWGGMPALESPNDVLILFDKVDTPPTSEPQSAIWHFGWHVADTQGTVKAFDTRPEVKMQPLFTTDEGGSVLASSDTWPGEAGALGRTKTEIAQARVQNIQPIGKGGFAYMSGGPEDALFEIAGDYPAERFNHVHMWQEDPFCALLWYKKHLNAPVRQGFPDTDLTEDTCKVTRGADRTWPALKQQGMFRTPRAGVEFGDVVLTWYANQGNAPLVSSRGQMQDHIGLSVADLDAWVEKLRGEGVTFLEGPYRLGDTRAVMIEGPSREAIELVEVK